MRDVIDVAAEGECVFVFLDSEVGMMEIEVVNFRDTFMDSALFFGVICEGEEEVKEWEGFGPTLIFDEDGQFEIDGGSEISIESECIIEAFDSQVVILRGVQEFAVIIMQFNGVESVEGLDLSHEFRNFADSIIPFAVVVEYFDGIEEGLRRSGIGIEGGIGWLSGAKSGVSMTFG